MRAALLATLILLAGCLSSEPADADNTPATLSHADIAAAIGEPISDTHDHLDPLQHQGSYNVDFVSWSTLGVTLGNNGFANFVLWDDGQEGGERLALVAVDGDTNGGFAIADVRNPASIELLGFGALAGNNIQEVRITPDGRFALTNIQTISQPQNSLGLNCPVCLIVWNIEDRANPQIVGSTPVELAGTHNMDVIEMGGAVFVHYVGQPLAGVEPVHPGNHVWIGRLVEDPALGTAHVVPVGYYEHDRSNDNGRTFPHDVMVQEHPVTGQLISYVSHWDGGHVSFDVTNPLLPVELDTLADPAPSEALAIHWIWQEEWVRPDGRVIAWSAPEIGTLDSGTGVVRALDVTDPANMEQVGTWQLPGNTTIPGRYIHSPHTVHVDPETLVAAVSHYHAGVWLLDTRDPENPRHVGYYLPTGEPSDPYDGPLWWKKPNFSPDGYGPNVYQVRWDDRGDETYLWLSDRGTGLYALQFTGALPATEA